MVHIPGSSVWGGGYFQLNNTMLKSASRLSVVYSRNFSMLVNDLFYAEKGFGKFFW